MLEDFFLTYFFHFMIDYKLIQSFFSSWTFLMIRDGTTVLDFVTQMTPEEGGNDSQKIQLIQEAKGV